MANGNEAGFPRLVMWGERGLVTTLFLDLSQDHNFERWTAFLRILDPPINGEVTLVWSIVEPDFGRRGFGSPDLVAKLIVGGTELVLLLEAKRTTYVQSSRPQCLRGQDGFNSKINGQMELNYRLSLALSEYFHEIAGANELLQEPDWVVQTPYGAAEADAPRYLVNPAVLNGVAAHICGLPLDRYHHVIITTDENNPLEQTQLATRFPQFFDDADADQFGHFQETERVHWTSWNELRGLAEGEFVLHGPSLFLPSFELNKPNLRVDSASLRKELELPHGRNNRGVSMIRLRDAFFDQFEFPMPSSTFVHFSWRGRGACLRNYVHVPRAERRFQTEEILPHICEEVTPPEHRPIHDEQYWHYLTLELNERKDCDAENRP